MRIAGLPEVWGGLECSVVRIGNDIRNQISETGHGDRDLDLDLIAGLGIKTLRYPVLWETICAAPDSEDWRWHDLRLDRLRKLGISPIAGLVHHGSGPRHCDVLDPAFPEALARHAGNVARRYPWIDRFTPVNEPMTTARLCGLYGHWYPHGRDEATCFRVVVAECRAVAASMKEIRRANPAAKLVQTEDIGRVFSTPLLRYQADHENERRWLALDLLTGRVDNHHPLYRRLLDHGIDERQLAELREHPCPPDILGIDQYLTSDRFLDEDVDFHPQEIPGGNSRHVYVDIAAARAGVAEEEVGFLPRIREAWERYGLPIALAEVHNGCTREEQLRWLLDAWSAAEMARSSGVDVRAVTVWSLLGATDWNTLLTRREGFYEPGAFDSRFDPPRPTVVASAIRDLAQSGRFDHPALRRPGWWRADRRQGVPRPLVLSLADGMDRIVADRCADRRLDVVEGANEHGLAEGAAWAVIETASAFGAGNHTQKPRPLRLTCRYLAPDSLQHDLLVVEAPPSLDPAYIVDAFLDLVVDGEIGRFRVTEAGPGGQYAFESALPDDVALQWRRAV
jgi:dTDP-4-dehydrorhamnose reductase